MGRLVLGVLALFAAVSAAHACGSAEAPCETDLGSYHIVRPATDGPVPAFLHFHGYGAPGSAVLGQAFTAALVERGYAVIAPNALRRGEDGPTAWGFRPERPGPRDEYAFVKEVIADAAGRHGVDTAQLTLSGYSIGGSMVWYLACRDPALARAYTPYAGGFWRPHPEACAGPVKLLHTHGWRDQTVPLEGRPLGGGRIYQGDIFEGLQVWRAVNGCERLRPDAFSTEGRYWRRKWTACAQGTALELALWPGGHTRPDAEWAEMAADWVEALP
ncbi:MAG: CocE/NonD family hydrolase [Pseudomonadota bacterium]